MTNNFFNDSNKAYSENLNDGILVGNAFDWTVDVSLPTDTGGVFPNSSTIGMAKVADVYISPNSNLSIGSTISNSSGSSQVYRLTVYPNFNRYGGFKSISVTASSGVTFYIANKGGTTPIANNLDYTNLSNVPELKVLKEYDIVVTIPTGKSVTGLSFVFQSSDVDVYASLAQSNVTGLGDSLASKVDKITGKGLSTNDFTDTYKEALDNNGWVHATTSAEWFYADVYVNPSLRLVDFHYYQTNWSFNNTNPVVLINGVRFVVDVNDESIDITPVMNTPLTSYNATIVGGLSVSSSSNPTTTLTVQTTATGTKTINLRGMWHY